MVVATLAVRWASQLTSDHLGLGTPEVDQPHVKEFVRPLEVSRFHGDRDADCPKNRKLHHTQDRQRKWLPERRSVQIRLGQRCDLFALEDRGLIEPALPAPEHDVCWS